MRFTSMLMLLSLSALAERQSVPLMPARDFETPRYYASSQYPRTRTDYSMTTSNRESARDSAMMGIEFGVVGKNSSTKADVLGMQALVGGRFSTRFNVIAQKVYLTPSLGYFRRSENQGIVGITQHSAEAGVLLLYALQNKNKFRWMAGLSQRLEALFTNISVGSVAGGGAPDFIYRVGPAMGFVFGVGTNMEFLINAEASYALINPSRIYTGLTMGIAFPLVD